MSGRHALKPQFLTRFFKLHFTKCVKFQRGQIVQYDGGIPMGMHPIQSTSTAKTTRAFLKVGKPLENNNYATV